jgi:hypothetical protein
MAPVYPGRAAPFGAALYGTRERAAEKVLSETEGVPQGLKPHCKQNTCGTAEAVPLSKTGFFRSL